MKIFAIVNRKGGVAKTTTAHAMGAYLTRQGFRVLFIDLDSQCNLSAAVCGALNTWDEDSTAYSIFSKEPSRGFIYTNNGADIIPGSPRLATADTLLSDRAGELKKYLKELSKQYDYVILDCPPGLGMLTTAALIAATDVIITAGVDLFSIQAMTAIIQQADLIRKKLNKRLTIAGVLLTRYDKRSSFTRSVHEQIRGLCEQMHVRLFDTVIRENIALKEAQAGALDIFAYAPRSNGAKDYTAFMEELLHEEEN